MPALPDVPGVIKIEFLWTQDGVPAANVLHVGYTGGPPTSSDLTTLAHDLGVAFMTAVSGDLATTTLLASVKATDLASHSGAVGESALALSGTDAVGGGDAAACVLCNFQITRRYRGGHPRMYILGYTMAGLATPSTWAGAVITNAHAGIAAYVAAATGVIFGSFTTTTPVSVSYRTGNAPRVVPVVDPIVGFAIGAMLRTQRRRINASTF